LLLIKSGFYSVLDASQNVEFAHFQVMEPFTEYDSDMIKKRHKLVNIVVSKEVKMAEISRG
jgi:hypothetical protein